MATFQIFNVIHAMREDKKKELNTEKKLLEKTMNEFTTENKLQKEIHDQDIRLQT